MAALLVLNKKLFTESQKTLTLVEALIRTEKDKLDITGLERLIRNIKEVKTLIKTYYVSSNEIILLSIIVVIVLGFVI